MCAFPPLPPHHPLDPKSKKDRPANKPFVAAVAASRVCRILFLLLAVFRGHELDEFLICCVFCNVSRNPPESDGAN